jgi:uncharacterized protein (TIGR02145 family)
MKNLIYMLKLLLLIVLLTTGCDKTDDLVDGQSGGIATDNDGNSYQTIVIGEQVWMIENLKTTKYRNGDPIPEIKDASEWGKLSTGAYCVYENYSDYANIYGNLYNWHTVNDKRKIAPKGWHVPTTEEWKTLMTYVSDTYGNQTNSSTSGENGGAGSSLSRNNNYELIAKFLASTSLWDSTTIEETPGYNVTQNNQSGFSALPGGFRDIEGKYLNMGTNGRYWSSSDYEDIQLFNPDGTISEGDPTMSIFITINHDSKMVYQSGMAKGSGCSVRCLKD